MYLSFIVCMVMGIWMVVVLIQAGRDVKDKEGMVRMPSTDSSGFVTLTDAVPDAILEIRYFGTYNFVGTRIDGYMEPTALLTGVAADSLRAVSDDVKGLGYRLKIYDAYRPQRAVDNFVRWAEAVDDTLMRRSFYPDLDKGVLFEQGPRAILISAVIRRRVCTRVTMAVVLGGVRLRRSSSATV